MVRDSCICPRRLSGVESFKIVCVFIFLPSALFYLIAPVLEMAANEGKNAKLSTDIEYDENYEKDGDDYKPENNVGFTWFPFRPTIYNFLFTKGPQGFSLCSVLKKCF